MDITVQDRKECIGTDLIVSSVATSVWEQPLLREADGDRMPAVLRTTTNLIVNELKKRKFTEAYLSLFGLFCWDDQSGLLAEVGGDMAGAEYKVCFPEQKVER